MDSTRSKFIEAAASYFGLPAEQVTQGSIVGDDAFAVQLRVDLTPDDVVGIAKRMETMREPEVADERDELRKEYNGMDERTRKHFGSFQAYAYWRGAADPYQVEQKAEVPAHVWLNGDEVTDYQRMMALSTDEAGRYAVSVDDLTPEQAAKRSALVGAAESLREGYVARTVAATERLSGADGKPTSNADDFGGLPG